LGLARKTATKLASLSALGAGTLILASPEQADASIIVIEVNQTISTLSGPGPQFWQTGPLGSPGGPQLTFGVFKSTTTGATVITKYFGGKAGGIYPPYTAPPGYFRAFSNYLSLFSRGAAFPNIPYSPIPLTIGRLYQYFKTTAPSVATSTSGTGAVNFANKFAFFSFYDINHVLDYGWVQLSQQFDGTDLNLTIHGFAYDDQGNRITAGETPEPGTLGTMAMGALILGAAGLKRWRAARKSE
jgi:hypothetical protein